MNPQKFEMNKKGLFGFSYIIILISFFLFATIVAMTNFARLVTSDLAKGEQVNYTFYFIIETTGAYTLLFLALPLIWFFIRFPLKKNNFILRLPFYILVFLVFGALHTLLMYLSRTLIYWLIGWGTYDYGIWKFRLPMEYTHQIFSFLYVFGIVYIVQSIKNKQEQEIKTAQLKQELTKARLQALQTQLNPHFFFNTLNMISSTMYDDVKAADKMIADLGDILRITLKGSKKEEYTLEKELEILGLYIEIMKARFQDRLSIDMDIDPEIRNAHLPQFLLQPLIENSIKHSIEIMKKTKIKIHIYKDNSRLVIKIIDNGPGITSTPDKILRNGLGLSNTKERLENLYKEDFKFFIQNREAGGLEVRVNSLLSCFSRFDEG